MIRQCYSFELRNEVIIAFHVRARGVIRRIAPQKLRAWEFGTGLAVRDWLLDPRNRPG